MARDKHKSPVEVTYRKQFEPAHLTQAAPAFLLYGCNLKPSLSGSQLELDSQVDGGEGGLLCLEARSYAAGAGACVNTADKC